MQDVHLPDSTLTAKIQVIWSDNKRITWKRVTCSSIAPREVGRNMSNRAKLAVMMRLAFMYFTVIEDLLNRNVACETVNNRWVYLWDIKKLRKENWYTFSQDICDHHYWCTRESGCHKWSHFPLQERWTASSHWCIWHLEAAFVKVIPSDHIKSLVIATNDPIRAVPYQRRLLTPLEDNTDRYPILYWK